MYGMIVRFTAQKMKFFIKDFFSKCDQICSFLQIWSHVLKKSLMESWYLDFETKMTLNKKIKFSIKGFFSKCDRNRSFP